MWLEISLGNPLQCAHRTLEFMSLVVITGVTRGLGRAMAEELIRLGHAVCGCGRAKKSVEQLGHYFAKPNEFEVVEMSSDEQVQRWANRGIKTHSPPALSLNNYALYN